MGDRIWVDPRTATATLGTGPQDHNFGALQVVGGRPSGLEGQRDETFGPAFRTALPWLAHSANLGEQPFSLIDAI